MSRIAKILVRELYRPQIIAVSITFAAPAAGVLAAQPAVEQNPRGLALLNASLEHQVQERTAQLSAANVALTAEISERSWAVAALRENAARLRSYFALPRIGIAITSLVKGWLEVNAGLIAMLGYSPQELAGLTCAI